MRRSLLLGLALGVVALALLDAALARAGLVDGAIPRTGDSWPWLLSRAAGVTAYVALSLDVVLGLLVSTRLGDRIFARGSAIELHRWLSASALGLSGAHATVLLLGDHVRFDALDALLPFASAFKPLAVGVGVLGLHLALAVHFSFELRSLIGPGTWRRLHYASFGVFALATGHAALAGTDAGAPWLAMLLASSTALVAGLTVHRVVVATRRAHARPR